jgi:hypothetical protein
MKTASPCGALSPSCKSAHCVCTVCALCVHCVCTVCTLCTLCTVIGHITNAILTFDLLLLLFQTAPLLIQDPKFEAESSMANHLQLQFTKTRKRKRETESIKEILVLPTDLSPSPDSSEERKILGRGGSGLVYEARWNDMIVAVKTIPLSVHMLTKNVLQEVQFLLN